MRKLIATISAVILGTGLVVYNALPASAAEKNRHVTVTGTGTIMVVPDAVRFYSSVSVLAQTNKEALASASRSASAVRAALRAKNIATRDIRTSSLSVFPEYNYTQDKGSEIIGYRATQSFTVIIRKADSAGEIVDAVVDAGGNSLQIGGIAPFVTQTTVAAQQAREAAVADARARASSYAKLLGESLGRVMYLTEVSAPTFNFPVMAAEKSSDATQIDLGESEVTVSVTVRWALN